jgi:hypothetical protein
MKLGGSAFDPLLSPNLSIAAVGGTPDVSGRAKIGDWYGMITGRLGYAWGTTPTRRAIINCGERARLPVHSIYEAIWAISLAIWLG